jgi:hypothetical protein
VQLFNPEQPKLPQAALVWSMALDKNALSLPANDSEFTRLRSAAIAGERVVAIFEIYSDVSRGGRPVRRFRLNSIDLKTGKIVTREDTESYSFPYLYATDDDHIVVGHASLARLNPDLTESGEHFKESAHGHVIAISPDGSTLARRTEKETELLSADTLLSTGMHIKGPEPSAVSKSAVLSNDKFWVKQFPRDASFVTLYDEQMPHLLYHGKCGGRPLFLSEEKILFIGCGKITLLDKLGGPVKEIPLNAAYARFAGVSRDNSKFAILSSSYPLGDPSYKSKELFTIYSAETYEPIATVAPETLPEEHSWSAFSRDGTLFLSGGPKQLALYRIP